MSSRRRRNTSVDMTGAAASIMPARAAPSGGWTGVRRCAPLAGLQQERGRLEGVGDQGIFLGRGEPPDGVDERPLTARTEGARGRATHVPAPVGGRSEEE